MTLQDYLKNGRYTEPYSFLKDGVYDVIVEHQICTKNQLWAALIACGMKEGYETFGREIAPEISTAGWKKFKRIRRFDSDWNSGIFLSRVRNLELQFPGSYQRKAELEKMFKKLSKADPS